MFRKASITGSSVPVPVTSAQYPVTELHQFCIGSVPPLTTNAYLQTCNYMHIFNLHCRWQVIKYSFSTATSMEIKPWRTVVYPVCKKIPVCPFFSLLWTAFLQSAAFSIFLSAPFPSISLSLGTVWLVRPVIELLLFDQGSNRNCTLLTQLGEYLSACVHFRKVHTIVYI